jgi:hypothetical protein
MPEKNKTYVGNVITARAKVAPSVQEWVDGWRTWDENDMCPQERLQKAEQRLPAQYSPTSVLPLKRKALNNSSEIKSPTSFTVGRDDPGKGTPPQTFGITNRVAEILNLAFDVLEQLRG